MKKIYIITVILTLLVGILTGCSENTSTQETAKEKKEKVTINIGIQQILGPLMLAKNKGWFEEEFAKLGLKVKWSEFQSGPPHFEAVASNRLDFGIVGNSPVLGAQAAGIAFKEIASISEGLKSNAIIVQKDSPIKKIQDLKGKKVAVAKGSSGFDLLYKALDKAGINPKDVEIIQLQPDEAQPAFETGSVDAWAIWDPFISNQVLKNEARVLADGESLDAPSPVFIFVREKFAEGHPDLVIAFLKVYEKALKWQNENEEEAVAIFAKEKKLAANVVKRVLENSKAINEPISKRIVKVQQNTADFQYSIKAIQRKIDTSEVVDNSFINQALEEAKQ